MVEMAALVQEHASRNAEMCSVCTALSFAHHPQMDSKVRTGFGKRVKIMLE